MNQQLPKGERLILAAVVALIFVMGLSMALLNALGALPIRPK